MSYFILRNGQQYGPYSPADIERYLTVGGIVATDLARTEEMNQWLPLAQIIRNTPPPPTAAENLDSEYSSGGGQRQECAGPGPGETSLNVQPMPPPDHAQAYPVSAESGVHKFFDRIRHFLSCLHFGVSGAHKSGQ